MTAKKPRGALVGLIAVCVCVIAVGALLEYRVPWPADSLRGAQSADADAGARIRISEVMTSNASAHASDTGAFSDWVEIENAGDGRVNLRGYALNRADDIVRTLTFPDIALEPGEYLLVYADGMARALSGQALHAPFRLSASGAAVVLTDASGAVADEADIPRLSRNEVYRRDAAGAWEKSGEYTPGAANTLENHLALAGARAESPVVISEVMASNASYAPDAEGLYHDYIELHNASAETVSLNGYALTDNSENPAKWRFPSDIEIAADGCLIVYASGLNGTNRGDLHANFKLSAGGEEVLLTDGAGNAADGITFPALRADQAYSRADGAFTVDLPPTPGLPNTVSGADAEARAYAARSDSGVCISEVMASSVDTEYDWLEVANITGAPVDISGWGLSDNAAAPRKWQFPAGTVLAPNSHTGIFMAGFDGKNSAGVLYAGFRLAMSGRYALTLSTPDGAIADRVYLPEQYAGISYARMADGAFRYTDAPTPNAPNADSGYTGRAGRPVFSTPGGLYAEGDAISVELTAAPGARIYYTLDSSDPDERSALYTAPIAVGATTVLRARAYIDGELPSYTQTQTYFFGASHTMRIVSLVSDPENLQGETGIHTNYQMDWEREGHVEVYEADGARTLSAGCGLKLHGADSRKMPQKNFKVIARSRYGANRFDAALFSQRDYDSYQSFILRSSSEDGPKTRMRDSVLTKLAAPTSVFYQETELCVVYINGIYWGHYNMRERITTDSICQFEGWSDKRSVDLVKGNTTVMRGSDETYQQMLSWVKKNGVKDDAALERVGEVIDLQNFIEYHALQIFVGNADTLNVKRYRNRHEGDGKWRWVIYDLDWGFYVDTNSIGRWLDPEGMGSSKRTDNALFRALFANDAFRDRFLTFIGDMLATEWTTDGVLAMVEARYERLLPELPAQFARWRQTEAKFRSEMSKFVNYAKERPKKLIGYFRSTLSLGDADMERYFGDAIRLIQEGETS